jgi:hypothetical protein
MTACFVAHYNRLSTLIIISGIAPKQNAFKFKIAPHKQKSIVKSNLMRRKTDVTVAANPEI